ncbi:MAG: hypothetical protein M1837_002651 [Sclerophora amabilis]|nr:MAG: hypothetical protein M1837_002651 [Sclerophora amabilis]
MAKSESSASETILYLRPQTRPAIDALDIIANEPFRFEVAPPPDPADISIQGIPNPSPTDEQFPPSISLPHPGITPQESTPDLYPFSPRVFRLGFHSVQRPSSHGFEFGSGTSSDIMLSHHSMVLIQAKPYFRIHHNFNSGALMVTALDVMRVGSAFLEAHKSLLIMPNTIIHCGGVFEFKVEFPDTTDCAKQHERNYMDHASKLGFKKARYLRTPQIEYPPIGTKHRSVAILGRGGFGVVHKALRESNGRPMAIKVLSKRGGEVLKEADLMSRLSHKNIIQYERAFDINSGETCIGMELAANDLPTHLKAREKGKSRSYLSLTSVQSIGRQALSGLDYLHKEGFMHRDLKPQNILVTDWDASTNTPTVKLADFGLAGVHPEHNTFCGTDGYIAPEVREVYRRKKELRKQGRDEDESPSYTNAVDIWAMGKVLEELLQLVPSQSSSSHGEMPVPASIESARHLIARMMRHQPQERPTAAECLEDPFIAIPTGSDILTTQKRERSSSSSSQIPTSKRHLSANHHT